MKHLIRQLLPPAVSERIRKRRMSLRGNYNSYAQALANCDADAYGNQELVASVVEKTERHRDAMPTPLVVDHTALATIAVLGLARRSGTIRILDFGGAAGHHYNIARVIAGTNVQLLWRVVETAQMCAAAKHLETDELQFFDSVRSAAAGLDSIDYVFASASIPYCANPLETVRDIVDAGPDRIFVCRTPLVQGTTVEFSTQRSLASSNGPGDYTPAGTDRIFHYPIGLIPTQILKQQFQEHYLNTLQVEDARPTFWHADQPIYCYNYLFERRDLNA